MSKPMSINKVCDIVRQCDLGWFLEHNPKESMAGLKARLESFSSAWAARGEQAVSPDGVLRDYETNPHRVRAFLQAVFSSCSPEMLVMTWRILLGMEIAFIELSYRAEQSFHMRIALRWSGTKTMEPTDIYESDSIDDFSILRHLGIAKVDGRPFLDGFYALHLK